MIKVVKRVSKKQNTDLAFWLTQTPEECLSCVELLRRQYNGNPHRLQRSVKFIQLTKSYIYNRWWVCSSLSWCSSIYG